MNFENKEIINDELYQEEIKKIEARRKKYIERQRKQYQKRKETGAQLKYYTKTTIDKRKKPLPTKEELTEIITNKTKFKKKTKKELEEEIKLLKMKLIQEQLI